MRMVEQDQYCVDIMKQSYAVRSAIDKVEALILDSHLRTCVVEGVTDGRGDEVIEELMDLYEQAKR